MNIVKVICTCKKCGKKFEARKNYWGRPIPNNYEEIMRAERTECCDCKQAFEDERNAIKAKPIIEKYGFPMITGDSEKKIDYANRRRNAYIVSVGERQIMYVAVKYPEELKDDGMKKYLQTIADSTCGGDYEKAKIRFLQMGDMYDIWTLLNESDADKVIETLKF